MEIPIGPLLSLGMLAFSLYLFVRYGGTEWLWNLRLWIFHTIWRFSTYFFDDIVFSPDIQRLIYVIEQTEFSVFIILLILIFFLDNKRVGRFIFKSLNLKTIALMTLLVATCWWFVTK